VGGERGRRESERARERSLVVGNTGGLVLIVETDDGFQGQTTIIKRTRRAKRALGKGEEMNREMRRGGGRERERTD
jgi:hypothetical protein